MPALDRFSTQAADYARYRIDYPTELYDWLLPQVESRERAWDCATGNGQVAVVLADSFVRVDATDLSEKQLAQAAPRANINYQTATAERTSFPDQRFDLITVAQAVHWFEPAWKAMLSTKALLPVLWQRNPGHRLLLPAWFDGPGDLTEWVAKPLFGREGDNIRIHLADGSEDLTMPGPYGAEGYVYQAYTQLPVFDGNQVVLGSWIIDNEAAGMIVRESDGMVTDYFSRVVPHVISDTLGPDAAQVEAWLLDRVGPDAPRAGQV